jgi:hypothetical protein
MRRVGLVALLPALLFASSGASAAWWCSFTRSFYPQTPYCQNGAWLWITVPGDKEDTTGAPVQPNATTMSPVPGATAPTMGQAGPEPLDEWCSKITQPLGIALCSDPELRRLAAERQTAFNKTRGALGPEQQKALLGDQKRWIEQYPVSCGLDVTKPPPLPLSERVRDCMAMAGRQRTLYIQNYPSSATAGQTSEGASNAGIGAESQSTPTTPITAGNEAGLPATNKLADGGWTCLARNDLTKAEAVHNIADWSKVPRGCLPTSQGQTVATLNRDDPDVKVRLCNDIGCNDVWTRWGLLMPLEWKAPKQPVAAAAPPVPPAPPSDPKLADIGLIQSGIDGMPHEADWQSIEIAEATDKSFMLKLWYRDRASVEPGLPEADTRRIARVVLHALVEHGHVPTRENINVMVNAMQHELGETGAALVSWYGYTTYNYNNDQLDYKACSKSSWFGC